MKSKCKVIAVENQKGGTGKSTTVLNLGVGLANSGKRVLLIDADPQGSLSISLGISKPDDLDDTLANVMAKIMKDEQFEDDYALIHCEEGVDLMPCNIELSGIESTMFNAMSREFIDSAMSIVEKANDNEANYDKISLYYVTMLFINDQAEYMAGVGFDKNEALDLLQNLNKKSISITSTLSYVTELQEKIKTSYPSFVDNLNAKYNEVEKRQNGGN